MRPSAGQNKQNLQGHPPQGAREYPTNTKNTRVSSPNRPRPSASDRLLYGLVCLPSCWFALALSDVLYSPLELYGNEQVGWARKCSVILHVLHRNTVEPALDVPSEILKNESFRAGSVRIWFKNHCQ
eukprot:7671432-Pyramimonas_sp.AAC.1